METAILPTQEVHGPGFLGMHGGAAPGGRQQLHDLSFADLALPPGLEGLHSLPTLPAGLLSGGLHQMPGLPGTSASNPLASVVIGNSRGPQQAPHGAAQPVTPPRSGPTAANMSPAQAAAGFVPQHSSPSQQVHQAVHQAAQHAAHQAFMERASQGLQLTIEDLLSGGGGEQLPSIGGAAGAAGVDANLESPQSGRPSRRTAAAAGSPRGATRRDRTAPGDKAARSSRYRGVTKHRRSGRFEAHIWVKDLGRQVYLGGYEVEEHAAEAYDIAALKCKGRRVKTNFEVTKYEDLLGCIDRMTMEELVMAVRRQSQGFSRGTSSFRGVTHHPSGRWEARIGIPGSKHIYLGLWGDEREAARAYDRALVRLRGRAAATNFALSDYKLEMADYHKMQAKMLHSDRNFSAISDTPSLFERWIKAGCEAFPELCSPTAAGARAAHSMGGSFGAGAESSGGDGGSAAAAAGACSPGQAGEVDQAVAAAVAAVAGIPNAEEGTALKTELA